MIVEFSILLLLILFTIVGLLLEAYHKANNLTALFLFVNALLFGVVIFVWVKSSILLSTETDLVMVDRIEQISYLTGFGFLLSFIWPIYILGSTIKTKIKGARL